MSSSAIAGLPPVERTHTRSWFSYLLPSLCDLFFFAVIGWSFLSGGRGFETLLMDGDAGLHIRIGDWILQNGTVPHTDLFGFSRAPDTWYAFEWLSEVVFAWLHAGWGLKGVVLLSAALIAGYMTLLLRFTLSNGSTGLLSLALVLITSGITAIHYHARPHLFTLVILCAALWLLFRDREQPTRWLWSLIPITILWTNLHGGFFVFFVVIALLVIASAAEALLFADLRAAKVAEVKRYTLLGLGCAAASLVNPYGIHLHEHIRETLSSKWIMNFVDEFKSPSFRSENLLLYMGLLFAGLMCVPLLVSRRRLFEPLLLLFFAYASLSSVRHVPLFAMVATPIVGAELTRLWRRWAPTHDSKTHDSKSTTAIISQMSDDLSLRFQHAGVWIPLSLILLANSSSIAWPRDFSKEHFPLAMVEKHAAELEGKRVFTTDQISDYLVYRFYPKQRVFMDGRHNYYGEKIGNDFISLLHAGSDYAQLLDKYKIETVLLTDATPLATALKLTPGWRTVEKTGEYILLVRQ
jgi:hypothetical protein